jgi:hypothetical protein
LLLCAASAQAQPQIPDATEQLISSWTRNAYRLAALRYYAQARVFAVSVDLHDAEAVRFAMDHVFAARGCLAQAYNDLVYQSTLVQEIDASLLAQDSKQAGWSTVRDADRHNVRRSDDIGCPFPHPSTRQPVPGVDPWEHPESPTPIAVVISAAATSVSPTPVREVFRAPALRESAAASSLASEPGLRTFVASLGLPEGEYQTAWFYARTQNALAQSRIPDESHALEAWYANRNAEACLAIGIEGTERAYAIADRIVQYIAAQPGVGDELYRVRAALSRVDMAPEAIRPIHCPASDLAVAPVPGGP